MLPWPSRIPVHFELADGRTDLHCCLQAVVTLQVEAAAQHSSIRKSVVSAGSKSVSRMNAMIQKTSKAVKV